MEGGYKAAITIDPRNITLEPRDGKWTGALQFLVVVGNVEQLTTIPLNFTEAVFHQIEDKGLILGAHIKTPPGATGFSVGFRDVPSGMAGTLHVALGNAKKRRQGAKADELCFTKYLTTFWARGINAL
jgi:hypothetical protein